MQKCSNKHEKGERTAVRNTHIENTSKRHLIHHENDIRWTEMAIEEWGANYKYFMFVDCKHS